MKISVCMATYNGEKYIKKQIDSILYQLSSEDELIISDDGSNDKTLEIIKSYTDTRIKLLLHEKNNKLLNTNLSIFKIIANNFENALKYAQGDFVFLSDQDDIWKPIKISIISSYLKNYDMVYSNYSIIDENDNVIKENVLSDTTLSFSIIRNIIKCNYLGCCIAFKKEMLKYILPFPKYLVGHDLWVASIINIFGTAIYLNTPLHLYRRHTLNISTSTEKSKNNIFIKISYRICFLFQLFFRIYCIKTSNCNETITYR